MGAHILRHGQFNRFALWLQNCCDYSAERRNIHAKLEFRFQISIETTMRMYILCEKNKMCTKNKSLDRMTTKLLSRHISKVFSQSAIQTCRPKDFIVTPSLSSPGGYVRYIEIPLREREATLAKERLHVFERELGHRWLLQQSPATVFRTESRLFLYDATRLRCGNTMPGKRKGGMMPLRNSIRQVAKGCGRGVVVRKRS